MIKSFKNFYDAYKLGRDNKLPAVRRWVYTAAATYVVIVAMAAWLVFAASQAFGVPAVLGACVVLYLTYELHGLACKSASQGIREFERRGFEERLESAMARLFSREPTAAATQGPKNIN